jgi:hypothetical protein
MIFKILLLFFHCTNSFQILNGNEEDLLALRGGSVTIHANTDKQIGSCSLKKNDVQICQMTWERRLWIFHFYEKMSCTPKFNHVKYRGGGSYSDCKFVVPNLQENGKKSNLFFT